MYTAVIAAMLIAPAQPPAKHEDQNSLYKNLIDTGLDAGGKEKVKFPKPTMPDGLTAEKQTEIIKALIAKDYPGADGYANFTRESPVAPQLLRISNLSGGDAKAPVRGVDVWFVAHGDFKKLEDDKFLDKLTSANKGAGGGKGAALDKDALAKRKIEVKDPKRETYGTFEFDFLEKVRLSGTGHATWSRSPESIVAAAEIDPRFVNDKEFPNQWRSITKVGAAKVGDPNPWSGAAMYMKITKLQAPAGAVFIEQHIVFAEPTGWFDGTPLLTSKLPPAVQINVRDMRKEFMKK